MATGRSTPTSPPSPRGAQRSHYHESFVEKKGPQDQDYKKFWAGLHGLTIYFYNSNRDTQHVQKLDLGTFVKLRDEPTPTFRDISIYFSIVLRYQEVKFKVENLESREMWKGFILTVVELQVPSNLTLLPGHFYMMAEALAKEEERRSQEMPRCYLNVTRLQAQMLLDHFPECGNLLLRPRQDGTGGLSVTTRQILNGTPKILHYKVNLRGSKYEIDVEEPFFCSSLEEVVNYFVKTTNKALLPFLPDEDYEKVLGYPTADKENGESEWVVPSATRAPNPGPSPSVPKVIPQPRLPISNPDQSFSPPVLPRIPQAEEAYVIPIADGDDDRYVNGDASPPSRPVVPESKTPRVPKPLAMPKPDRRILNAKTKPPCLVVDMSTELELILQKRREHLAKNS
ncbi:signal-transducing adaptor protein 2 [Suncus etruscus]|uniref:signal-transducing adaptor protein 2 n=1 Tax=Suncus etruscus TaxID=109475 RepID=UPI00210F78A5|nr:signal-transducing adaptor protein 2 [Suncus etruscus]